MHWMKLAQYVALQGGIKVRVKKVRMKKVRMEKVRMKFKMIQMLCLRERRKVQRFYGGFP